MYLFAKTYRNLRDLGEYFFFKKSLSLSYDMYRPICVFFNGGEGCRYFLLKNRYQILKEAFYEVII